MHRRVGLVIAFFICSTLTAAPLGGADSIQELLKISGKLSGIDDPIERDLAIKRLVGFGFAMLSLCGLPMGYILELLGPKITAVLSYVLHGVGYILLFLTDDIYLHYLGSAVWGISFQGILNSHLSVSVLFPSARISTIITILASTAELSSFIPPQLLKIASVVGVQATILGYLATVVPLCIITDGCLLPMKPFSPEASTTWEETKKYGADDDGSAEDEVALVEKASAKTRTQIEDTSPPLWRMPFLGQILSNHFLVLLFYFVAVVWRKRYIQQNLRSIFLEIGGRAVDHDKVNRYMKYYNDFCPFSVFPSVFIWSVLMEKIGTPFVMVIVNILSLFVLCLTFFGSLDIQIVTIVVYIFQDFVKGMTIGYLAKLFGFQNLPRLQGLMSTTYGAFLLSIDSFWKHLISTVCDGSYLNMNIFFAFLTVLLLCCGLFFLMHPPPSPGLVDGSKICVSVYDEAKRLASKSAHHPFADTYEQSLVETLHAQSEARNLLKRSRRLHPRGSAPAPKEFL